MPEGEHFTPEMLDRDEHPHNLKHQPHGRFRKRPVVIEAFQWRGHFGALEAWLDSIGEDEQDGAQAMEVAPDGHTLLIATLEDYERKHAASLNDWVIRGVAGEFYACKPDIFAATYEPAPPQSAIVLPTKAEVEAEGFEAIPVDDSDVASPEEPRRPETPITPEQRQLGVTEQTPMLELRPETPGENAKNRQAEPPRQKETP